jgi:hypothetical protein
MVAISCILFPVVVPWFNSGKSLDGSRPTVKISRYAITRSPFHGSPKTGSWPFRFYRFTVGRDGSRTGSKAGMGPNSHANARSSPIVDTRRHSRALKLGSMGAHAREERIDRCWWHENARPSQQVGRLGGLFLKTRERSYVNPTLGRDRAPPKAMADL